MDHPSSADGHYLLGYVLFKQANARDSLAEYTAGAKYRIPSAFDLKVVACDYVLLKDYPDADKWFTRSVERNPKDAQAWYYLGRTKYYENRFDEAVSAFKQCLMLQPKDVRSEDNLGLAYQGLGRNEEAEAAYLSAIQWQREATSKDFGPLLDLGSLLIEDSRTEEAIPYLLKAVQIAPHEFRAHRELGKAYLRLSQLQKAEAELETAIKLAPEDASLHYILGQVYRKAGLSGKAKIEFDRYSAMRGSPEPPSK